MDIIGHQKILKYFEQALNNESLAHAYLFVGPRYVGKRTVAAYLISKILKLNPPLVPPLLREEGKTHPDIVTLKLEEDKKNMTIEQVRNLRTALQQTPLLGRTKIALIEEAQNLSLEAANALLKTLEEPAGSTILFLTSSQPHNILPTIDSRCQVIRFKPVPQAELESVLKATKVKQAVELAHLARGLPGLSLRFAQNPEYLKETKEQTKQFLKLLKSSLAERLSYVDSLFSKKQPLNVQVRQARHLLQTWQTLTRDIMLSSLGLSDRLVNSWVEKDLSETSKKIDKSVLLRFQKSLEQAPAYLQQNVNPRLVMENILLELQI